MPDADRSEMEKNMKMATHNFIELNKSAERRLQIYIYSNIREIGDDNFTFLCCKSIIKFWFLLSLFYSLLDK